MGRGIGGNTLQFLSRFAPADAGAANVRLLLPPYQHFVPVSLVAGRGPPYGAIALAGGRNSLTALGALTLVVQRWPWLVPVLEAPASERATFDALRLVSTFAWRVAVIGAGCADSAVVIAAVRRRPFPTAVQLAHHLGDRLGRADLTVALVAQFDQALTGRRRRTPSSATYSRLFRTVGELTARDWRALAVMLRELHRRQAGRTMDGGRVPQRTLLAYARRLLGATCRSALDRLGWEWMVEEALRVGRVRARELRSLEWLPA